MPNTSDRTKPIHPLTSALILGVLYISIITSAAATYGIRAGIAVGFLLPIIGVMAFGIYEVLTWKNDDHRWEVIQTEADDVDEQFPF